MQQTPEIAVSWDKPNHRSNELFNVPPDAKIILKMTVQSRAAGTAYVVIGQPNSSWLTLSKYVGKVPFTVAVTVNTTGLQEGTGYREILEFRSMGQLIYTEPIYVTTKLYDSQQLKQEHYSIPINPGQPSRNPFRMVLNAILTVYHLFLTVVYLWVGLFVLVLIIAVITAIIQA